MHDMDSWWYSMQHGLCMKWLMVLQVTQVPSSSGLVCGVKFKLRHDATPRRFLPGTLRLRPRALEWKRSTR